MVRMFVFNTVVLVTVAGFLDIRISTYCMKGHIWFMSTSSLARSGVYMYVLQKLI